MNRSALVFLTLALMALIHTPDTLAGVDSAVETERVVIAPDNVSIRFDDQGKGDTALVFVHGWSCDRSYWNHQRDFFKNAHRVITLDLAGHGESGSDREEWTMQSFGADVAAVVEALDLHRVILIGHSMGGKVVVEAASQLRNRVLAVVGADTFHNGGRATSVDRNDEILEALDEDYIAYVETLVARMFIQESNPAIRSFVSQDMAAAPPFVAIASRRASGNYDATPAIASLEVPLVLISSDFLPTDIANLNRFAKSFEYREMTKVGHFLMLEDPETFNAHLAAVISDFN